MGSKIATYTGIVFLKLLSRLPLFVLYLISDVMYPVVYYLVGYRRKVVSINLKNAFPEKTTAELEKIEKEFYHNLCDIVVETIKTRAMPAREISRRMVFLNPELINSHLDRGESVIVVAMHYGNWEWLLHMPLFVKLHPLFVCKPMQNALFDQFMNHVRERFGGETVPMSIALRKLIEAGKQNLPVLTWLAADQAPPWNHPFWIDFMNQQTNFFNGPAKLARRFNQPVYFQQIRRIKRGYYETWFEPLVENPLQLSEETITTVYVRKTESVIRNEPGSYIWSHRRWKYKKPGDPPVY